MHESYLNEIERAGEGSELEKLYLWPAVDMWKLTSEEIQKFIIQRVGLSDYAVEDPGSRPYRLIQQIKALCSSGFLPERFSLLDITFGDGVNLWQIQKAFPHASLYGLDSCAGSIDSHEMVASAGVSLHKGYIQHLFAQDVSKPFDVAVMLNTYRGWESAKLRPHEVDLPQMADSWFEKNARAVILTATEQQIRAFKRRGYRAIDMGKGEDRSRMICLIKKRPQSLKRMLLNLLGSAKTASDSKART